MPHSVYDPFLVSPTLHHKPTGANLAAVVTLPAFSGSSRSYLISEVGWSYSATPASGSVQIVCEDEEEIFFYVTTGGPGFRRWLPPKRMPCNKVTVITTNPGGVGVFGGVDVNAWPE